MPDCGSSWILPRLIGMARAMELSMLAERLPAETALQWGMINRLEDDAYADAEDPRPRQKPRRRPEIARPHLDRCIGKAWITITMSSLISKQSCKPEPR